MNLGGVLFEALPYKVYISERYYVSLVCKFKRVIKKFELNIDVQKGP
jgi:hypothetical protein